MNDLRTFIKIHDGLPDQAFRLLIELWCWSSRHLTDGAVPAVYWLARGTARSRAELVKAGLAEPVADGVAMHDYLEHQRSAAQVRQQRAEQNERGNYANHVHKNVVRPGCPHCTGMSRNGKRERGGHASPSSDTPGDPPVDNLDPVQAVPALSSDNTPRRRAHKDARPSPAGCSPDDPPTSLETEGEVEREEGDLRSLLRSSVDRHPADRNARKRAGSDDAQPAGLQLDAQQLDAVARAELRALTGRAVSDEHAAEVRRRVLDGRSVRDPRAYLVKALRADPAAFLRAAASPADRPLAEALVTDGCPHGAAAPELCALCRRIPEGAPA